VVAEQTHHRIFIIMKAESHLAHTP
jgi:hypothetical protein